MAIICKINTFIGLIANNTAKAAYHFCLYKSFLKQFIYTNAIIFAQQFKKIIHE